MTLGLHLGVLVVLLAVLVFLSMVQSAVNELSEVQLRVLLAEHEKSFHGRLFKELVENYQPFLLIIGFGSQIIIVCLTILVSTLYGRWESTRDYSLLWALLTMFAFIGLFRQLLPQLLAQRDPERLLLILLPALLVVYRCLQVLAYPIYRIVQRHRAKLEGTAEAMHGMEDEETDEEEIQAFIDVGEEEGIIEESEGELIQSIVELGDRRVAEIMTPRSEIVAVRSDTCVRDALNALIDTRYSRIPVYGEHLDTVEGIIYLRDLLRCWRDGQEDDQVREMARPAYFVPETKSAGDLLEEMRTSHTHIAMVVDEFGGIAGLITIEDLLEEIVGEIQEETGLVEPDGLGTQPDGSYLVNGNVEIRKIEEIFDTEIEADDFTTVAGLIIRELKHLPTVGEQLRYKDLLFEVVAADRRRVLRIRVRPVPADITDLP